MKDTTGIEVIEWIEVLIGIALFIGAIIAITKIIFNC